MCAVVMMRRRRMTHNLGSSSVISNMMLIDCNVYSFSFNCLLRPSATAVPSGVWPVHMSSSSSSSAWCSIANRGMTFDPDTLSSDSSTVILLKGDSTFRDSAIMSYCSVVRGTMSIRRPVKTHWRHVGANDMCCSSVFPPLEGF